jgi:hypothetical protein
LSPINPVIKSSKKFIKSLENLQMNWGGREGGTPKEPRRNPEGSRNPEELRSNPEGTPKEH